MELRNPPASHCVADSRNTQRLTESCLPISAENAFEIGLVDVLIDARGPAFMGRLASCLHHLCEPTRLAALLQSKRDALPPAAVLAQHRHDELARMRMDFNGPDYAAARRAFVYKEKPGETPDHLARFGQFSGARNASDRAVAPGLRPGDRGAAALRRLSQRLRGMTCGLDRTAGLRGGRHGAGHVLGLWRPSRGRRELANR